MATCAKYKTEREETCKEYRDEGHNACSEYRSRCCDWWPCSWACEVVSWFCDAWYWIANVVCVAWNVVTTAICIVWDVVTTVVDAVIETIESIVSWIGSAIGFFVGMIFAIPYIGRLLKWIWNGILTLVWGVVSLIDVIAGLIGIRPEKKLRVCVVMLNDERGRPLNDPAAVVPDLQAAIDIYREQANVRVLPAGPFQYASGLAGAERASTDWIHGTGRGPSGSGVLDVSCGAASGGEDLSATGSNFEVIANVSCFYTNFRRLVGYGAPIIIFLVRDVKGTESGCSVGPLTDYVVVEAGNPHCIAHEMGHACSLWHVGDGDNLMFPQCGQRKLSWWQIALLRASRHVTYF
ncbi:MAG TPA: hypothetical protein VKG03_00650 [Solirubrobacterales bacterium]|nr:hypothetical protein [Solirubrobacterales bacterium]